MFTSLRICSALTANDTRLVVTLDASCGKVGNEISINAGLPRKTDPRRATDKRWDEFAPVPVNGSWKGYDILGEKIFPMGEDVQYIQYSLVVKIQALMDHVFSCNNVGRKHLPAWPAMSETPPFSIVAHKQQ